MGKKLKNKKVTDAQRKEYYVVKEPSGKINKLIFPNTLQVGLKSDLFNSTISGSIHHTRQGVSYLVAGSNIAIVSGSNGQITVSATAGASASPSASFTRSIIPVDTDDTGGAIDDGGDLSDADIPEQAFTKIDVSVGTTNVTFAGHNETGNPANNTYKIVSDSITAFTDNGTELTEANSASEGASAYNITFTNSGTRLTLAVSTDSSDAKLKVSTLSEHEASTTDFNSIVVNIPIKYTTDAGTSTVTRSFTVQKIKKGTTGDGGTAGFTTPDASFTRSMIPVNTDDTGGALDDGNDLADADISQQAFTKIDVNVGITNVTFAGHNESGNPSNNTYKIASDSITAVTDNGTSLTEANTASEGNTSYNVTFANASATRLKLAISTDSSDAKFRVSGLAEHEDGSSSDFSSVLVNVPIKVTTAAGTQTITRSFTVQKIKKGTTGSDGDDGDDGAAGSGVVVSLDPMAVTLPAASDGTVSSFTASGATIKVHENGTAINVHTSLSSNSRWFVVSANGSSITAGSISQTNGQSSATIADASSMSATTATIAHVVRVKNSLGVTSDYTLTQTLTKGIAGSNGSDGDDGALALAIFGINSSSGEIAVVPTAASTAALTTPYDTAIISNTNVVASNSSGELTLAATGTYSVTVSIRIQQEGDASNGYELVLSLDDGAGSYTSLSYLDDATPGGDEKTSNLLISNAIVIVASSGTKKIKSEIKKSAANSTYAHIPQSDQRLATIRVEKLS